MQPLPLPPHLQERLSYDQWLRVAGEAGVQATDDAYRQFVAAGLRLAGVHDPDAVMWSPELGKFVAIAHDGTVFESQDGTTWTT